MLIAEFVILIISFSRACSHASRNEALEVEKPSPSHGISAFPSSLGSLRQLTQARVQYDFELASFAESEIRYAPRH
jgi:hypothetical protein